MILPSPSKITVSHLLVLVLLLAGMHLECTSAMNSTPSSDGQQSPSAGEQPEGVLRTRTGRTVRRREPYDPGLRPQRSLLASSPTRGSPGTSMRREDDEEEEEGAFPVRRRQRRPRWKTALEAEEEGKQELFPTRSQHHWTHARTASNDGHDGHDLEHAAILASLPGAKERHHVPEEDLLNKQPTETQQQQQPFSQHEKIKDFATKLYRFTEEDSVSLLYGLLKAREHWGIPREIINVRFLHGGTALHIAAGLGHTRCVSMLLRSGADPELTDKLKLTALHVAVLNHRAEVVTLLLQQGVNVNARTRQLLTPLHITVFRNPDDVSYVSQLLEQGADINARTESGFTPLHYAVDGGFKKVTQALLDQGADVNAIDAHGKTPLHSATADIDTVQLLLTRGADVNSADPVGTTALHLAAGSGKTNVALALIAKGANIYAVDRNGDTFLHRAVKHDQWDTARELLGKLSAAAKQRILHAQNAQLQTPLHLSPSAQCTIVLLGHGALLHILDKESMTPLHTAAHHGRKNVLLVILQTLERLPPQWKAMILEARDLQGQTALHHAAVAGHTECVRVLIQHGANVKAMDKAGRTVVQHAIASGKQDVVRELEVGLANSRTTVMLPIMIIQNPSVVFAQPGISHHSSMPRTQSEANTNNDE